MDNPNPTTLQWHSFIGFEPAEDTECEDKRKKVWKKNKKVMQRSVLVSQMGTSTGTLYFLPASQCINFICNHVMKYTSKYAGQPNKAAYMTVNSSC